MDEARETGTMTRTRIAVDDIGFYLAQGQTAEEIRHRIEDALQAGGAFVDFVVVGNRTMSVLITPRSRIVISREAVDADDREMPEQAYPFGGTFDLL